MSETVRHFVVAPEEAGERFDRYLAQRLDLPRNRVHRAVKQGLATLRGETTRPSASVQSGDAVVWREETVDPEARLEPEAGALPVLYEDEHLAVIDKPAGLAVHPGTGRTTGTLAHRLLHRWPSIADVGHPQRPGIVHRLDLGTTGAMVVALDASTHRALSAAFAARQVAKRYLAVVWGKAQREEGFIDAPIGRHPVDRKTMAVRDDGRPARTRWRRLDAAEARAGVWLAVIEIDLETGRTHQIRVHMKHDGHPLAGDPVYGAARWKALPRSAQKTLRDWPRPALHAHRLGFVHPVSGERMEFEAPVPQDLRDLWRWISGREWPSD